MELSPCPHRELVAYGTVLALLDCEQVTCGTVTLSHREQVAYGTVLALLDREQVACGTIPNRQTASR